MLQKGWHRPGSGPAPSSSQHLKAPHCVSEVHDVHAPPTHARLPWQSDDVQHAVLA